jgi:hypothetical protein
MGDGGRGRVGVWVWGEEMGLVVVCVCHETGPVPLPVLYARTIPALPDRSSAD